MNLENLETKETLIQDFFTWLFDDERIINNEVSLAKEIDFTLAPNYMDANIYFPKQIGDFFNTKAMRRLGRISQLDLAIDKFPNVYHNRLDHSKGVYNRKLEEMLHNFQEPSWRAKIEQNKLKLHILAELIKMSGHDIGHLPLSHALEVQIFSKRGVHEIIGRRIMLEDPEIQSVLNSISSYLPNILKELYEKPILNFETHDESNYDVDRFDYISRDNLYAGTPIFIPYAHYRTVPVIVDNNGTPQQNNDGSIITFAHSNSSIDVYDYSSLKDIEHLLEVRESGYKNLYFAPETHIREGCLDAFFDSFLSLESEYGQELRHYITKFGNSNIQDIDLSLFLEWDDIKFYSQIIEIAEYHENPNIRLLATMTIPNMNEFLKMIYSHLGLYAKQQTYTEQDKHFLKKIKSLIIGNSELSQNLKNPNFTTDNTLVFSIDKELPDDYKCYITNGLINSSSVKVKAYKKSEPIYIRDKNNNIYELSIHPDRMCNWDTRISYVKSQYAYVPFLKLHGLSDTKIEELSSLCSNQSYEQKSYKVNMHPLQVDHNMDDYFLEL